MGAPRGLQGFTVELWGPRPALKTTMERLASLWPTLLQPRFPHATPTSRSTLAAA